MEQQLNVVVNFVENDLNKWLGTAKSRLKYTADNEDNDTIVSDFIGTSAEYINSTIVVSNDLIDQETLYLQKLFGNAWNQICQTSKTSLISAGVLWMSCAQIRKANFDFSGICISATSALEADLKQVFFVGFQRYMELKYGKPDYEIWGKTFEVWPEKLLSWNKNDYEKKSKQENRQN